MRWPRIWAILGRQGIEDVGDIGRMQLVDLRLQLGEGESMDFDSLVIHRAFAIGELLDQAMSIQHVAHAGQVALQLRGWTGAGLGFSHHALAVRHACARQDQGMSVGRFRGIAIGQVGRRASARDTARAGREALVATACR